tara:strand:+ start:1155 stop:1607 length:453 start_codon:yes stop_codon:yes gene_type:complete
MKKFTSVLLLTLFSAVVSASVGHEEKKNPGAIASTSENTTRTIEVTMDDTMRFTPSVLNVKKGETVRLVVKNIGQLKHELVIGEVAELKQHANMMKNMPNMKHDEDNAISLEANESGEIMWVFERTGKIDFSCLIPGHLEAGMNGKFNVI